MRGCFLIFCGACLLWNIERSLLAMYLARLSVNCRLQSIFEWYAPLMICSLCHGIASEYFWASFVCDPPRQMQLHVWVFIKQSPLLPPRPNNHLLGCFGIWVSLFFTFWVCNTQEPMLLCLKKIRYFYWKKKKEDIQHTLAIQSFFLLLIMLRKPSSDLVTYKVFVFVF